MATVVETAAASAVGEPRVLIRGVGWQGYQSLLSLIGDQPVRLTYDRGDVGCRRRRFTRMNGIGRCLPGWSRS